MKLEIEQIRQFDSVNGTFGEYQVERYVFTEIDLKMLLIDAFSAGAIRALNMDNDDLAVKNYINKLFS